MIDYSSLLILKEIMSRIQAHERRLDPTVACSAHPLRHRMLERIRFASSRASPYRPNERDNPTAAEANSRFLPADYFDYIGDTSTGEYDIPLPKQLPKGAC